MHPGHRSHQIKLTKNFQFSQVPFGRLVKYLELLLVTIGSDGAADPVSAAVAPIPHPAVTVSPRLASSPSPSP